MTMAPRKTTPSWTDVKSRLADIDRAGLVALLHDLYAASKDNQTFLHARFALGDEVEEAAQCCESTVARADRDAALDLTMLQEGAHFGARKFGQGEARDGTLVMRGLSRVDVEPGLFCLQARGVCFTAQAIY
jgi:hypothetical protein